MAPEPPVRVVHYIHDHTGREPILELADIWARFQQVVFAQTDLNNHTEKFLEQQLAIAREGRLCMPSPFSDSTDTCTESYYLHHRFFYRFVGAEEYYWSTNVPEQLLAAIYFPNRDVAVAIYPGAIEPNLLAQFEELRTAVPKRDRGSASFDGGCALVVGFVQFMHMLWNHLPALERAVTSGIATELPVAVTHEPFGPTQELFPELAGRTTLLLPSDIPELNRKYPLLVGLGSRRLPLSVRERVRRAARQRASTSVLAERELFRAASSPIFWLSIKPPDRTCVNQAEALATIIAEVKRTYPDAGFILDGPSRPWDYEREIYDAGFRAYLNGEIAAAERLIEDILERVDPGQRASIFALCGISACDEIVWAEIADFYFCHGGTPHHKIGWLYETPGMMFSNSRFIAYYQWMNPLVPPPPIYYLPARLVVDDPASNYAPEKLARKDQNFTLLAPAEIAAEILNAYRHSQSMPGEMPSESAQAEPDSAATPAEFFQLPEHTGLPVQEVVRLVHRHLKPKTYIEIGEPGSATLGAVECASIAVGEGLVFTGDMVGAKPSCSLFQMSTDTFFADYNPRHILNGPIDVALLAGMPLFEALLRAFHKVERHCKRNSIVLVGGCLPTNAHMTRRERPDEQSARDAGAWTGDAWKLPIILKKVRPELRIRAFNAPPAGLLAITSLDPDSDVLDKQYFAITEQLRSASLNQSGAEALLKAMNLAGTDVFDRFESLSPLFWL